MSESLETIKSVEDAVQLINSSRSAIRNWGGQYTKLGTEFQYPFGIWFRGHSKLKYELEPSILRKKPGTEEFKYNLERPMLIDATLKLYSDIPKITDKLCLMQHHRFPSRILDWTENILVALYFAVQSNVNDDGVIYILNALNLNSCSETMMEQPTDFGVVLRANMAFSECLNDTVCRALDEIKPHEKELFLKHYNFTTKGVPVENCLLKGNQELYKYPIAFSPNSKHKRMQNQMGTFTIHAGKVIPEGYNFTPEKIPLPEPISLAKLNKTLEKNDRFLKKAVIPKSYKKKIRIGLRNIGINRGTIFPDLENKTMAIADMWDDYEY